MSLFDEWKFLAGLGIFLFGMFSLEESVKRVSGRSFKTLIRRYTGTRIKGLITGFFCTAILQSSSAVSLMVLAFVGAGLMTMVNAIAVMMGAMVGTTLTAWIVAVFGFKFKIEAFSLPLIGLGGLGLIFLARSPRYVNISKLLAAFGFLFLGLDFMKTSVEDLAGAIDLTRLPDLGLWVYVLAGIVLTAVMQSSSATIAIVLTTIFSGIISFDQGAAMVIGANVGTTVTVLLGAIGHGAIPAKKQAAVSSLAFNLGTAAAALAALPVMFWIIQDVFGFSNNAVLGIALFHTLFNVMGVVIFFPLIPALARVLKRFFPETRTVLAKFINNTDPEVPEAALAALRREVLNQLHLSMQYIAAGYGVRPNPKAKQAGKSASVSRSDFHVTYGDLSLLHAEIFSFYAQVQTGEIDQAETGQMESFIRSSRSIMNATRNLHEMREDVEEIGRDDNSFMVKAHGHFKSRLEQMNVMVEKAVQQETDRVLPDVLGRFFQSVEEADKQFIRSCSNAVARGMVRVDEVTRLLMVNRLFTQSNRMLVLSMQALTKASNPFRGPLEEAPAL